VDFLVFENGDWKEFDWFEEFCITYDGRFPYFGQGTGKFNAPPFKIKAKTPWEGEITYSMVCPCFIPLFSTNTLKLKITIKDRALHTSNTIETPEFTLDGIRGD
jgi:hypothetical protein